jgi:hypothetical protein
MDDHIRAIINGIDLADVGRVASGAPGELVNVTSRTDCTELHVGIIFREAYGIPIAEIPGRARPIVDLAPNFTREVNGLLA